MKCIVVASIIVAAVSLRLAMAQYNGQPTRTGTCASIGYDTSCCPPTNGDNCKASDCYCNASCRWDNSCCSDAFCTLAPMTCQQVGWTSECCQVPTGSNNPHFCDVMHPKTPGSDVYIPYCSCDIGCHHGNRSINCCTDIDTIGCGPNTCTLAGKAAGCCQWGGGSSCRVEAGDCYCDSYCFVFGDCCEDIQQPQCSAGTSSQNRPVNVQTDRRLQEDLMKALHTQQQYKLQRPSTNTESSNAAYYNHHRMAISSRLETARRMNQASEFRGRAHVAQRPHYYNNGYNNNY